MQYQKLARSVRITLAACAVSAFVCNGVVQADDAQDNAALREQMRIMMQRMDEMQKQIQSLTNKPAPPAQVQAPASAPATIVSSIRSKLSRRLHLLQA